MYSDFRLSCLPFLILAGVSLSACGADIPAAPPDEAAPPPFALEGIYKGVSWVGGRRPISEEALALAQRYGIEWIAQTPFGWMDNQHAPQVRLNRNAYLWGEADRGLRATTREAHARGIRVMLKPHLWLRVPIDDGWIGEIDFPTEEGWRRWEADYRTFILHYARLAAEEHVEILCIATELSNPVRKRSRFWKALIRDIREVYPGELTYAANWSHDFDETDIWSVLDYIGINAYFPLSDRANPTLADLMRGWQPYVDEIEGIARKYEKPVLFTEIGYKNSKGATVRPWEWPRNMDHVELDHAEQANAYEAMFRMFGKKRWFRGLFIWKWFPDPRRISADRVDFSPQNKRAAEVLKKWYTFKPQEGR